MCDSKDNKQSTITTTISWYMLRKGAYKIGREGWGVDLSSFQIWNFFIFAPFLYWSTQLDTMSNFKPTFFVAVDTFWCYNAVWKLNQKLLGITVLSLSYVLELMGISALFFFHSRQVQNPQMFFQNWWAIQFWNLGQWEGNLDTQFASFFVGVWAFKLVGIWAHKMQNLTGR